MTSDTTPLSRIFLQHNWQKPLIVWVCNRFDYFDHETRDRSFPDREYYELIREAILKENVWFIPYTDSEWFYAQRRKKILFPRRSIRPIGSIEPSPDVEDEFKIPDSVIKEDTVFVYPRMNRHELDFVTQRCLERDIQIYSGKYNGPDDLSDFKAVLYFPYAWSNVALFENLQRGIIHLVPTERFVQECIHKRLPVRVFTEQDFEYCEWYAPAYRQNFIYFDSWDDLQIQIRKLDDEVYVKQLKERIKSAGIDHRQKTIAQWRDIFDRVYAFTQK